MAVTAEVKVTKCRPDEPVPKGALADGAVISKTAPEPKPVRPGVVGRVRMQFFGVATVSRCADVEYGSGS